MAIAPADGQTAVTVSVRLRYSQKVAATGVPLELSVTGVAVTLAATRGITDADGLFVTTMTSLTPGDARLVASIKGQSGATTFVTSVQFVSVAAGAALSSSAISTVGVPETAVVTILDPSGQRVLYYEGTVHFSSSDPLAVLPPLYQFTSADQGQHSFDGITFNTAGDQNLLVADVSNPNIAASNNGISVSVKTAPMIEVSGIAAALAGAPQLLRVRIVDIYRKTQTAYLGTVHFSSTDPLAALPEDTVFTATDAGVKVLSATLKTAGVQAISAVDTNNLAINGTQDNIAVLVQADRYRVATVSPTLTAGASALVRIAAVDAYGNVDPNYLGPAIFTSSDLRASLPSAYTFAAMDAGVYSANLTFFTAGRQTVSVQGASDGFSGATAVAVAGAPAQRLELLGPRQAEAGGMLTLVATAYDAYNNVSGSYSGTLEVSSSDANASLPSPVVVTPTTAGSAVLASVVLEEAGPQTVTVADANLALSANAVILVTNGPAATFALGGLLAEPAGFPQSVTVSAFDAFGNPAIDYTGSVLISSDDVRAQLPPATTFTLLDAGVRTLTPVVLKTAGLRRVSAADTANPNVRGSDANISIRPLAASALVVSSAAQAAVGAAQNVIVRAVDLYGNLDPNFAGTVTLTSSDNSASLPPAYTFLLADAGQATLVAALYTAGSQTWVASAGSLTSAPALVNVVASATAKLGVSGLSDGRAGRGQSLVIQALDNFNNLVPGYVGSVQITSSDANASLPGAVTLAGSDGGQKLVPVTLITAGLQSVSAHDVAIPSIAGTAGNVLVTAVASRLRVQAPSVVTAGGDFNLSVAGVDAYGNVDTTYTGTVSLSTTSAGATLPATLSVTSGMQGTVTVGNVALNGAGSNLTITAQDTLQPFVGTRSGILVQPGPATSLSVQAPALAYVGAPFAATLTAYDAYGNQATGYTGAVALTSSDPGANLGAATTFVAGGQGSAVVAGITWSAASPGATLTATDVQTSSITGTQTGIVVRASGAAKLRLFGATSGLAGHTDSVTVVALDNGNNLAAAYTGTVRLSSTDAQAVLPYTYAFSSGDAGTHVFPVRWGTAGTQRLAVQDIGVTALGASQNNIVITPMPAQGLRLTDATGGSIVAGAARSLQIAAVDGFNNVDVNYTGRVTLTSSDASASLPAPVTMASSAAGIAGVSYTLATAGTQALAASDAGSPALTGNLTGLVVQPGTLVALRVSGIADAPAGTSNSATIDAVDAFGNRVPTYTGTVHLSSSDPLAVLSGDITFDAQDQGSRAVQLTLFSGGPQSVTGTDTQAIGLFGTQANIDVRVHRSRLKIVAPSHVAALQNFTITVAAVDAYGNVDPNYTGSVALASSDTLAFFGEASSGGPGSAASLIFVGGDAGQKTLSNVTLAQASSNASIGATDGAQSLTGQRSGIGVAPGVVSHIAVSIPSSVSPGSPFAAQISVVDNANNVVPNYIGSLTVACTDANARLPSSITLGSGDAGSLRIGNLVILAAGPQTLAFSDANGVTGSATTTVAALAPVALQVSGATSGLAGHSDSITVTAVDAYGNPADGNLGVVTFSSSDAQAALPAPYALGGNNTHTFPGVRFVTAGTQTLRVSAAPPAGAVLVGQQNNIVITGTAATRYIFTGLQDTVAGQAQNVTLGATDAYGNLDAGFTGTVSPGSSDANAIIPTTVSLVAGQATFVATLKTAGAQTLSASGGGLSGTSPSVTVTAAALSRLAVSGVTSGIAGQSSTANVAAFDSYNNPATGYLGVVTLTSSDPAAALPASLTFEAVDAGSKSATVALFTPGTQTVTVTDTVTAISGQQSGIVITAGQRFALSGPASVGAGQPLSVVVQAVDNSNQVDASFAGTVHFLSTDARATLPVDVTFTAGDLGQKSVPGFALATAGAQGIMATTLPAGRAGALYPITVSIAAATGFAVAGPSAVTAGSNFNVTVTATDGYGNRVPNYTGTASITSNDGTATLPGPVSFTLGNAGVKTVGATLRAATSAATLAATDNSNPSFSGQQGNITVVPLATANSLALTGLTSGVAGHTTSITVTACDVFGNAVPQYRGTVHFASSDALANLPAAYTFVGADRGSHVFSGVSLALAGNQSVTVSDGALGVSQTVTIAPASATFFALDTNSSAISGQAQNVILVATDAYGNVDIHYAGTVTLASSDPMALLPASYTFVGLDAGRRMLPVTLQSAGNQSLSANASGGVAGMQGGILVSPGPTSRLSLSGVTQASTGVVVSATVRALDAAGNITPAYRGTTHTASSDPYATLPVDYTYTSGAGGQHSASIVFATAGNQSLTVTDTATPSIQGSLANVAVASPAARLRLVLAASATAGASTPLAVRVTDNFNNLATAYSGTVLLNLTDAQATYATQAIFVPGDQGSKTIVGAFKTAGVQTITATDTQGALVGASAATSVAAGPADHYDISAPATVAAGGNIALTLIARDAYGNPSLGYAGTAHFTSSDVTASVPANVVFSSGQAMPTAAHATLASVATTFTAVDVATPTLSGTSAGITVTPLVTNTLLVTGATAGVAGHAQSVTVSARDVYNNLVLGYRGVVALTSSDALATLPATYAFTAADAGGHTFAALALATAGNQSFMATDTTHGSITGQQVGISIVAGAATQVQLTGPASALAGTGSTLSMGATDAYGNLDPSFRGTVTLGATDAQANLPAPYAFTAGDAGNHNVSVTLATSGPQTLTAASAGLVPGPCTVLVTPGATRHLALSGLATLPAGTAQVMSVRAIDDYNNTTPSYRGSVAFASTDLGASLPGNTTFLSGDAGNKSLSTTLVTRGLQQVRAADSQNPNLAGAQNAYVTVAQTQLTVLADTHVVAGVAFNVTLSATDVYGNINPNYTGTVHLTSSDPNAVLPADIVFVPGNQGTVTLTQQTTLTTAGLSQSLSASDSANGLAGSQGGIVVSAGPAAVLALLPPATVTAGVPFTLGVSAYDAYNNLATAYVGHITFSAADANATLPPASTFTLANLGSKTFTNGARLLHAGSQIITVTDTHNLLTGSAALVVQSAAASALAIASPASSVAGVPLTLSVTAYDVYGNIATGMNDTVALAGSDASGTYPGSVAFLPTDAGSKTFTNQTTLRTATLVTVTATDVTAPSVTPAITYILVAPAPVASLVVTAPAAVTAATNFSGTVSAVDAYLNVVHNYAATVLLESTDAAGLPSSTTPFPVTFTAGSAAQRALSNLHLMTAGSQLLTAGDPNNSALFGSTQVQVNPGPAGLLTVAIAPNAIAGQPNDVTVTAVDAGANVAPTFAGTVTFSSTDANAVLPPAITFAPSDHGQKTLVGAVTWHRSGNQTLSVSSSGLASGTASVNVGAASAVGLQLDGFANFLAGTSNQATLRSVDAYGNTAPSYTGTVTWASSDPAATLPAALTYTAADAGSKTATVRLYTAGAQSVTATDAVHGFVATQSNIVVGVQSSRFVVVSPNSTTAGAPLTISVAAADAYGNLDANYTAALHFSSTDPNASFPAGVNIAASDHGQRSVSNIVLTTASPNATVMVLDNTNSIVGTSNAVAVAPANANRLSVVTPVSTAAGAPLTASVTAYDAYNNIATGYTGTVVLTTTNANAVLPGPVAFASGNRGLQAVGNIYLLAATSSATVTVTDSAVPSITGAQTGIQVTPLVADHFVLAGLTSGAAGHVNSLNATARDIYNNIATGYRGTVTFMSSDAAANLPANYTYIGFDQGTHAFAGVSLDTVGTQWVTIRDTAQASIAGTQVGIVIIGNSASHLTLSGAATTVAGQAQNILITAVDAYGNIDANFVGSVSFTTTDASAALPSSYTFSSADAGTYLLPVVYTTAATQTLTAAGPASVGTTQINTAVAPSNANAYVVGGIPNLPAGQTTSVTVRVIDAYNNTVPLYRGQAHVTSSDANAALPGDYTFAAMDNGVKALGLTLFTAGTQWVRAVDINSGGIAGQQGNIQVGVAQSHLQVTCNTNVVAGVAFPVTVTAVDAYGNLNATYTGRVHFSSGDANATLPGDTNVVNANNGSITLPGAVLRMATANQSITATDTNVASLTGAQSGIAVTAANASAVVLAAPATVTAGANFTGTLTAYDPYNNIATGYAGTVIFSTTDAGAALPASTTFTSSFAGAHAFANAFALLHAGNQNIVAIDANGLTSRATLAVSPAAPAALVLSTPAVSIAGNVIAAQVLAQDAYGNLTPSYRGTVTFSSNDANASYPPDYTFVASDNGSKTFTNTLVLRHSGAQVVSVADTHSAGLANGASVISVASAPLAAFRLSAPLSVTSETSFLLGISGLDTCGNIANTYTGTVRITSSDPNGIPSPTSPINLTFVNGNAVQRSVSGILLNSGGNQVMYATDANNPNTLNGQTNVSVIPLPATTLYLAGFPSTIVAGQQGNITVHAYDNYGNTAVGYTGTVHFSSSDANALLPADYAFSPTDLGVHTFAGLSLRQAGSSQFIAATDANGITGTQGTIIVTSSSPNSLTLTGPASATAGVPFTATVAALDAYGNTSTAYTGTVSFTNSCNGNKPADYAFAGSDAGVHVFTNGISLQQSGNQNVSVDDANGHRAVLPVSVVATNANALMINGTASTIAGQPLSLLVTAVDRYNNVSTPYRGTVSVLGSDTQGVYPATYAFTPSDAGQHTFNTVALRTAGSQGVSVADTNAASNILPGAWTVAVSPNTCVKFNVATPANVQPALSFAAGVTALDNYNNTTPAYTGTVNVLSSDANGLPNNISPLQLSFTGSTGTVNVSNLYLHALGPQSLSARDAALASRFGNANITVAAQNFTAEYDFTVATQQNYVYDPNQIGMLFNAATLLPIYTSVGDSNASGFNAGVSSSVAWDSNGQYLALAAPATSAPQIFFDSVDNITHLPTWVDTVDTAVLGGSSNVAGFCCGFSGPQSNPNGSQFMSASNAMLYSGYANGGGNTWAVTKVWDLRDQNMLINANSTLIYWIFPQATTGAVGNPGVNGNNSLYVSLDVVFADGSDTLNANILDSSGYAFSPAGQGNRLIPNQWTRVVVSLASLAGKQVDRIDIVWTKNGATGGYRGFVDDVYLNGTSQGRLTNTANFDATWTPRWNNMTGYWPFDGNGFIPNNAILAGVKGGNITATADNVGIMYVPGQVKQSVFLNGNDSFTLPAAFSVTTPFTMSFWYSPMNTACALPVCFGTQNANNLFYQPSCGSGYFGVNSNNTSSSFLTYLYPYGPFRTGVWQHVAMSLNGNRLTGYINGVPYTSGILSAPFSPLNGGWIGADSYGGVFRGRVDEVATWNVALDANEIKTIYRRQSAAYTGTQVSQVFGAPFLGQAAPGLGWTSTLPTLKGLPSNVVSESNTAYASLATNTLNSNLVALWHFEEAVLGSVPSGDFYDDTGLGNAAYGYGGTIAGGAGIVGNGVFLQYGVLITTRAIANATSGTVVGWINTVHPGDTVLMLSTTANAGGTMSRSLYLDSSGLPRFGLLVNGNYLSIASSAAVIDNTWHLLAATYDNTGSKLYVDGQLTASSAGMVAASTTTGYWNIGSSASTSPWPAGAVTSNYGQLDELAVWNRALGASEIAQLYRRGSNRVKYQVRQCTSATCADNPPWFGPSNDANSYFSEVNNVAYGAVQATAPMLSFPQVAPAVTINSNTPYVQYRMFFESDDIKKSCTYRGQTSPCSPEVKNVQVFRINYNPNAPAITNGNAAPVPYYGLSQFVETLGLAGCSQGITYNLSPDGTSWYYYTGSAWVSANGSAAQSNHASDYTSGVLAAFSSHFAFGDTYFKAFLNSSGTSACALSTLVYSGTQ